jgi:hypothetical protein
MAPHFRRLPISARHAFALAFDLAVRRDGVQSLLVPFLLHAPWVLAQGMLPAPDEPGGMTAHNLMLNSVTLLGDFLVSLFVAGMLRFRARSVFNTPLGTRPAPVIDCYWRGLKRMPWLFITELLRNIAMFGAGLFLVLPGVWVGFRLSMATEAAVLRETTSVGAFTRSFHLTPGRLERWLEMIAMSVVMVLSILFTCAVFFFALPTTSWSTWATVALLVLPPVMTIIQYAWTFFYLRLEEIDSPRGVVGGIPPGGPAVDDALIGRPDSGGLREVSGAPELRVLQGGAPTAGTARPPERRPRRARVGASCALLAGPGRPKRLPSRRVGRSGHPSARHPVRKRRLSAGAERVILKRS